MLFHVFYSFPFSFALTQHSNITHKCFSITFNNDVQQKFNILCVLVRHKLHDNDNIGVDNKFNELEFKLKLHWKIMRETQPSLCTQLFGKEKKRKKLPKVKQTHTQTYTESELRLSVKFFFLFLLIRYTRNAYIVYI